jgi:hypothetical protein
LARYSLRPLFANIAIVASRVDSEPCIGASVNGLVVARIMRAAADALEATPWMGAKKPGSCELTTA